MYIVYRRMSGAIGLTDLEKGTRGLWLEKRRALLAELRRRGHVVDVVNRMTKFSEPLNPPEWNPRKCELLIIEFVELRAGHDLLAGAQESDGFGDGFGGVGEVARDHLRADACVARMF